MVNNYLVSGWSMCQLQHILFSKDGHNHISHALLQCDLAAAHEEVEYLHVLHCADPVTVWTRNHAEAMLPILDIALY